MLKIIFTSFFFLIFISGMGQDMEFTMHVNKNPVSVDDNFKLEITLRNVRGNIQPPNLSDFRVLMGPSQSQNYQFINGRQSSSITISYLLSPLQQGTFTIEPARADVDGKTIETESIDLEVIAGSSVRAPQHQNISAPQQANQDLFVRIELSRSKVYQGEQIIATYSLYSRFQNLELGDYELPTFNGFWTEEIKLNSTSWERTPQSINGVPYRKAVLRKQILFPQRSGKFELEPFTITARVNRSFFNAGKEIAIKSNIPVIEVLPLPAGKPEGFNGAVGNYNLEVTIDRKEVKANEAINLNVKISGNGNLKLLNKPEIMFPGDFEVYDPRVNDRIATDNNGVHGSRTYEYLIIPRHEGEYEIEPFEFSYFHPSSKEYITLKSPELRINVAKGEGNAAQTFIPSSKSGVSLLNNDIRYISSSAGQIREKGKFFINSPAFYATYFSPVLALLLLIAIKRKREKDLSNEGGIKRRNASKMARNRLKNAEKALKSGDRNVFYEEIFKSIYGYLSHKLGIPYAELNRPKIQEELTLRQISSELQRKLFETIDRCEMARFTPSTEIPEKEVYHQTVELITELDQNLR